MRESREVHNGTVGGMTRLSRGRLAWWLYATDRALTKLTGGRARLFVYLFCAQPVGRGQFDAVREDPGTVVRKVGPQDALCRQFPRDAEVIRSRYAAGAECHAVQVKGVFAGTIWLARERYEEDEVRCLYRLPEGCPSVWDFDVYIVPALRGGRTMARLWKAVDRELQRQGVLWSYSRISLFNPGSIQSHERLGARQVATGCFLQLGRWQLAFLSAPARLCLSTRPDRRPELRLPRPVQD